MMLGATLRNRIAFILSSDVSDSPVAEVVRLQTLVRRHPNSDEFGYDLFDAEIIVGTSLLERSLP